jgi:hypothetical protein
MTLRTQVGDALPHPSLRLHRSAPAAVVPAAVPADAEPRESELAAEAELVGEAGLVPDLDLAAEAELVAERRRAS